jgi:hypothetical protein
MRRKRNRQGEESFKNRETLRPLWMPERPLPILNLNAHYCTQKVQEGRMKFAKNPPRLTLHTPVDRGSISSRSCTENLPSLEPTIANPRPRTT